MGLGLETTLELGSLPGACARLPALEFSWAHARRLLPGSQEWVTLLPRLQALIPEITPWESELAEEKPWRTFFAPRKRLPKELKPPGPFTSWASARGLKFP